MTEKPKKRKKPTKAKRDRERVTRTVRTIGRIIDSTIDYYALAFRVHSHDAAKKLVLDSFAKITEGWIQ